MSKYGKEIGIPKAADQRRVDAPEAPRQQKGKRRKKVYPPHWECRLWAFGNAYVHITPSVTVKGMKPYGEFPKGCNSIQERLDLLAERYPETAEWGVRWLSGAPQPCNRTLINN